jgi:hypothetical protein
MSAAHGLYIGNIDNKSCAKNDVSANKFLWQPEAAHKSLYNIHSNVDNKQLAMSPSGPNKLQLNKKNGHAEQWKIEVIDGNLTLYSTSKKSYVGCDKLNGDILFSSECSPGYYWKLQEAPDGFVYLVSSENTWYLSLSGEESIKTVQKQATDTRACQELMWKLVPCVPEVFRVPHVSPANQDRNKLLIIGATAGLCAIAAPFAVVGLVGAMGFGTGGIVGGSMAAGMMSAEAIAAGGGVVAGGTVATLQSIGAAGLGMMGMTASMGTGVVVGGLTSTAATKVLSKSGRDSSDGIENGAIVLENPMNRAFCAWKSW